MIMPLAVGNALRIILAPPSDSIGWRVLRKTQDDFSGPDDPDAYLVYEGEDKGVVDSRYLQNDVLMFYRAYYWDGMSWSSSQTATGTAKADYDDASEDVQTLVRERLEWGLLEEVRRGLLQPQSGSIPVLTAPPIFEDARWPLVTISVLNDAASERVIGELLIPDEFNDTGWSEDDGWLARTELSIVGWSQNPDERIQLRRSLRRLVMSNLSVFDSYGMVQVNFSQQDADFLSEYPAPVYQSVGTLNCLSPVIVGGRVPPITDIIVRSNSHVG